MSTHIDEEILFFKFYLSFAVEGIFPIREQTWEGFYIPIYFLQNVTWHLSFPWNTTNQILLTKSSLYPISGYSLLKHVELPSLYWVFLTILQFIGAKSAAIWQSNCQKVFQNLGFRRKFLSTSSALWRSFMHLNVKFQYWNWIWSTHHPISIFIVIQPPKFSVIIQVFANIKASQTFWQNLSYLSIEHIL